MSEDTGLPTWLLYECHNIKRLAEHFKSITPEITLVSYSIPDYHINGGVRINFNKIANITLHPDLSNCGLIHCHNLTFSNALYPILDSIFTSFLSAFSKSAIMYTINEGQVKHMKYFEKSPLWHCCNIIWRNRSSGNSINTWIFTKAKVN